MATSNGASLPKTCASGVQAAEIDDDAEWEGFRTPETEGVLQSDHLGLGPESHKQKLPRRSEPRTQKNVSSLQKGESSAREDENKAENSFKLLENTVMDDVDGM